MPLPDEIRQLTGIPQEIKIEGIKEPLKAYPLSSVEYMEYKSILSPVVLLGSHGQVLDQQPVVEKGQSHKAMMYVLFVTLKKNYPNAFAKDTFKIFLEENDAKLINKFSVLIEIIISEAEDIKKKA